MPAKTSDDKGQGSQSPTERTETAEKAACLLKDGDDSRRKGMTAEGRRWLKAEGKAAKLTDSATECALHENVTAISCALPQKRPNFAAKTSVGVQNQVSRKNHHHGHQM